MFTKTKRVLVAVGFAAFLTVVGSATSAAADSPWGHPIPPGHHAVIGAHGQSSIGH